MDPLPDELTARQVTEADLDAVYEALAADQESLHGEVDVTIEDLVGDWARPSFSLAEDAILVEDAEGVVGYVDVFRGRLSGGVDPRAKRRGIGSWLLDWGIERSWAAGAASVELTAPDADKALVGLLAARDFAPRWESWLFWRALAPESPALAPESPAPLPLDGPAPHAVPDALTLRNIDPAADAERLHELIDTAFADWSVRDEPWDFADWRAAFLDRDDVEPRTSWVLEDTDGALVGAALSLTDRGWGWLEQLAVRRDWRGRGLGTALLQRCFASYAELGLHTAGLGTESRTGARALYERNGLVLQRSFTRWSLGAG